jgi:hypothetical protein
MAPWLCFGLGMLAGGVVLSVLAVLAVIVVARRVAFESLDRE